VAADCERVDVPARWLTEEHIPYISTDLEKRPFFVAIGLLELADHFHVPPVVGRSPVVGCIRQYFFFSLNEEADLSSSFGTNKITWFCRRIVTVSFL
jgi:hypothetical protein